MQVFFAGSSGWLSTTDTGRISVCHLFLPVRLSRRVNSWWMWIRWLWVASKYWNKTLQRPVTRTIMKACCSYLLSFICASTESCYCKLDSLQEIIVFLEITVKIRHVTNMREDILPPCHPQFMRSMNFQKMFIVSVRFHWYRSFKSKLLNSFKGDCT